MNDLITVAEAAQIKRVSTMAIYNAIKRKELPHRRLGQRAIVIPRDALEDYRPHALKGVRLRQKGL